MASSRPLLERLLKTPDLATVVPLLPPDVLHRVIQVCGLEDSAEFVALATPAQLSRILDVDVWHAGAAGADEQLDADRFGIWLDVLMQSGAEAAAEKLIGLDIELVVAGFSRHAVVFDHAAVSSYTTLDGEHVPGRVSERALTREIGGYVLEARRTSAWDTIGDLLGILQAEHPEYFQRLMRSCVELSDGPTEASGFHTLLDAAEQDLFDLARDREARRERQGYVTPAEARAFMQAARHVALEQARPPDSPLARAYFRGLEAESAQEESPQTAHADTAALAGVVEVLRDAGVLTEEPRALLGPAGGEAGRLALIQDYVAADPATAGELAYLANAIVAGCSIQGRPFTSQEASNAAAAICNLGLDSWPAHWAGGDLIAAFQVGWAVLHREVSTYAAEQLIDVIGGMRPHDRDVQMDLLRLRREMAQAVRDQMPWRARGALEVIVMLDAPCWAALVALTDECPVLHAAIHASRAGARAVSPTDYEFISQRSQIAIVRQFMASLATKLVG